MSGIIGGAGSKSGVIGETEIQDADYKHEYGNWTPIWQDPSSAVSPQPSGYAGSYVKIGKFVRLEMHAWANVDTAIDNCVIGNLPFASVYMETMQLQRHRGGSATDIPWGIMDAGGQTLGLFTPSTTMWSYYQASSANWTLPTGGATIIAWNWNYYTND
jgi:hypothetical protein